jgi:hypothetical protein
VRAAMEAFLLAQEDQPNIAAAGSGPSGNPGGGLPARDRAP